MTAEMVESRSPQRPEEVVVSAPAADAAMVDKAVGTARDAAGQWSRTPALTRSQALNAAADALDAAADGVSDLTVREVGKPLAEARAEVARGVGILRYYAQQALDADGETYPAADGRSLLMSCANALAGLFDGLLPDGLLQIVHGGGDGQCRSEVHGHQPCDRRG